MSDTELALGMACEGRRPRVEDCSYRSIRSFDFTLTALSSMKEDGTANTTALELSRDDKGPFNGDKGDYAPVTPSLSTPSLPPFAPKTSLPSPLCASPTSTDMRPAALGGKATKRRRVGAGLRLAKKQKQGFNRSGPSGADMPPSSASNAVMEQLPALRSSHQHNRSRGRRDLRRQEERVPPDDRRKPLFKETSVSSSHVDVGDLPHSKPGWIGLPYVGSRFEDESETPSTSSPLRGTAMLHPDCDVKVRKLVEESHWTYVTNDSSKAQALVDNKGLVFAVKVRQPPRWMATVEGVELALQAFSDSVNLTLADLTKHDRGPFPCFSFGNSYGGGQKKPATLGMHESFKKPFSVFADNPFVQNYVSHVAVCFRTWFPRVASLFTDVQLKLLLVDGLANKHFPHLQFSAASLNLGQQAVCNWHRDAKNLVWGICAVGAFGIFNHRTSGHLLLREAKVAIELRRGDVIFFPSGSITHRNASLKEGETRRSIAFYTAGGNFRWISQGFAVAAPRTKAEYKEYEAAGARRWEDGWKLYCTMEDLLAGCSLK